MGSKVFPSVGFFPWLHVKPVKLALMELCSIRKYMSLILIGQCPGWVLSTGPESFRNVKSQTCYRPREFKSMFNCESVFLNVYVHHMGNWCLRNQKMSSYVLGLESRIIINHYVRDWLVPLGTDAGISARATGTLNQRAISSAQELIAP